MAFPKSQKQAAYLQSTQGQAKLTDDQKADVAQRTRGEELPPQAMHDKPYTGKKSLPAVLKNRLAVRKALKP